MPRALLSLPGAVAETHLRPRWRLAQDAWLDLAQVAVSYDLRGRQVALRVSSLLQVQVLVGSYLVGPLVLGGGLLGRLWRLRGALVVVSGRVEQRDGGAVLAEAGGRVVRGGGVALVVVILRGHCRIDLSCEILRVPRAQRVWIGIEGSRRGSGTCAHARGALPRRPVFVVFIFSIVHCTCPMLKTLHVDLGWDLNYLQLI